MKDNPLVWIRALLIRATEKAVLIQPANQEFQYWLPKSQVQNLDEVRAECEEELYGDWLVKEWIVGKNGIPTVEETGKEESPF